MSKLIALDWDHHQLRLLVANRQANRLTIDEIRTLPLAAAEASEGAGDQPAETPAARLVEILSDARFRGAEVFATVRRSDVELRMINLPTVPAEELPTIVRLQAVSEFSEISDDWPIDFLTLETTAEQTTVLAATISPRRIAEYSQVLKQAELRPKVMVLRPTATAQLVDHLEQTMRPPVEVVLEDLGRELELSVLRDGKPILIRTVQAPRSDSYDRVAFLSQEVKRTTLAARNQLHGDDVQRVVIFAADDGGSDPLGKQLEERLRLPVRVLDPFQFVRLGRGVEEGQLRQRAQLAAAVGLLISKPGDESVLIDFLNPRRAVPPPSRRRLVLAAVAGLLLVALAGFGGVYWQLSSLDQQAQDLRLKIQNQRPMVEAASKRIEEVASIEAWQRGDIDWLAQWRDISAAIPGPDKARFIRWQADVLSSGNGQLILEGVVDQQQTIGDIDQALRNEQRRVRTAGGDFEDREPGYPWRFKQTITIPTQPSTDTTAGSGQRPLRASRSPQRNTSR